MACPVLVCGLRVLPNSEILLRAISGIPMVEPGDDIPDLIADGVHRAGWSLENGDILVVSSKIISKAENRFVDLRQVTPSARALQLAEETQKDARLVELALRQSQELSRTAPGVLIVRHRLGFISANAGIDASNVGDVGEHMVLLLPEHPDAVAAQIRASLQQKFGVTVGIIISDTHGRPFRLGNIGVAIGIAGVPALIDQRGDVDLFGRELQATVTPLADELAAAAGLISGQADEGQPVVLIRGVAWQESAHKAPDLLRPPGQDLYV
jgi:coenzyme F420-0:L-glutamate ligase/coenzyme F420-1:gamma-L-glutamate ligase